MANEISYSVNITLNNSGLTDNYSTGSKSADQAAALLIRNVQNIGTSEAALVLGDVSTPGFAVFKNLDDTNFVEVGTTGFVPFVKLLPGEVCMVRLGATPYARADTAPVDLFYIIYEE